MAESDCIRYAGDLTTPMRRKRLIKGLVIVAAIYMAVGAILYFIQEKLLFHPKSLDETHVFKFSQPFREVNLPVTNEKNLSIIQFTVAGAVRKGIVLYYHGNRENVERYAKFAETFTRNGYEVWMPDYPGFGKSTGERSEQIMKQDAEMVYKMAAAQVPSDSIIIYGKSMGTGPASYVAFRKPSHRLILETPYYSIDALFRHYAFLYPVSWMAKYHFPNNEYLSNTDVPVHIFHGTDDSVIPYQQAKKLAGVNKNIELVTIEGGHHNNLADYRQYQSAMDSLLRR